MMNSISSVSFFTGDSTRRGDIKQKERRRTSYAADSGQKRPSLVRPPQGYQSAGFYLITPATASRSREIFDKVIPRALRRPSRAMVEELQKELAGVRSELLETTRELAEANARSSDANALTADANARAADANARTSEAIALIADERQKIIKIQEEIKTAIEAKLIAEQTSLERLRKLGLVNAREIVEWAEIRAKRIDSKRFSMNRFQLWSHIFAANKKLVDCLTEAGWPAGTLASNMMGLYASVSSDIRKDPTPYVSDSKGGIVISVNDTGFGVNATAAKVLLCLAGANFIRARLEGSNSKAIGESLGLSDPANRKLYFEEEKVYGKNQHSSPDMPMR